jgi:hypothetical protein
MAFADRLVDALTARGFEVKIDRQDLPKLEDWERELLHLIRQCDTVVFVVSPNSLASTVVGWEVEQVRLCGKRLAPVVIAKSLEELRAAVRSAETFGHPFRRLRIGEGASRLNPRSPIRAATFNTRRDGNSGR